MSQSFTLTKPKIFSLTKLKHQETNSPLQTPLNPQPNRIRIRKFFRIQKSLKMKEPNSIEEPPPMKNIFYIYKKTKSSIIPKQNKKHLGNVTLKPPKMDIYLEDIKAVIQNTFANQNALDLRYIKLYHQLLLEQSHQIYLTPNNSDHFNSDSDVNITINTINNEEKDNNNINFNDNSNSNSNNALGVKHKRFQIITGFSKKANCYCKKSNCLKNYCECKRNHERCDKKCDCENCMNCLLN